MYRFLKMIQHYLLHSFQLYDRTKRIWSIYSWQNIRKCTGKTTQSKGTTLLSLFFISKMMHSTRLEMFPPHCKRKTALDTTLSGILYKQATTTRLWIKFTSLVQRITRTISYIKRIPHVKLFIKTIAKTKTSFYESEYYLYAEKRNISMGN